MPSALRVRLIHWPLLVIAFVIAVNMAPTPIGAEPSISTITVTGVVIDAVGSPIVGAHVVLEGATSIAADTDAKGVFIISRIVPGTYEIDVAVAGLGVVSRKNIVISGDERIAIQYETTAGGPATIGRVSTTSNAGAKFNITAASVATISPSDEAFNGEMSWRRILEQIPGVTTGGGTNGGNSNANNSPDSPLFPAVISINGASPYETATLLDGMPIYGTSVGGAPGQGTNLGNFGLASFDAADIIRGPGADSPSIVNSIGGSLLLHSPGRVSHNSFDIAESSDPYGGFATNAKLGLRWNHVSFSAAYSAYNSPGPVNGTVLGLPSPTTINGSTFKGCGSPYSAGSCNTYLAAAPVGVTCYCDLVTGLVSAESINSSWIEHQASAQLSYDVSPAITASLFYAGSMALSSYPFYAIQATFAPNSAYSGSLSAGAVKLFGVDPGSYEQSSSTLEEKITALLGPGVLRIASLSGYSAAPSAFETSPNGNYQLWGTALLGSSGTPAALNGSTYNVTYQPETVKNGGWSNNRAQLIAYDANFGESRAAASYVTSYYNEPYDNYLYYPPYFNEYTSQPTSVSAGTREIRLSAGTQLARHIDANLSWYFASANYHLEPAANTWTDSNFSYSAPRFGITWHPSAGVSVRAASGGGFSLPALLDLTGTAGVPSGGGSTGYYSLSTPNYALLPETSFGFDVGTDVKLSSGSLLAFDAYQNTLHGQFFQSTAVDGTFNGLPLYVTQYRNLAESRYEGVLLSVNHDIARGLFWNASGSLNRAYVVSLPAGFYNTATCTACTNLYVIPNINFNGKYLTPVPYAQGFAKIGYRWAHGLSFDVAPQYFGNGNSYYVPAFVAADAHLGYSVTKHVSVLATFRNITNAYGAFVGSIGPGTVLGAPTIKGAEDPLYGQTYGPRAAVVTVSLHF